MNFPAWKVDSDPVLSYYAVTGEFVLDLFRNLRINS